jgi:hypothetical protein
MAAPPDFIAGATLTALQMNQVGMWVVKRVSVGFGVSSVTISDAFSADYDSYRIIYSGGSSSVGTEIRMTLGASAAGYYSGMVWSNYAGVTGSLGGNGIAYWNVGSARTAGNSVCMDIHRPFVADETWFNASYVGVDAGSVSGSLNGYHNLGLSYTAFTFTPGAGTLSGGTITVYGYRK